MDREKVINELTECIEHIRFDDFPKIPFWGDCQMTMMNALQLLKELPVWHVFHTRDATEEEKEAYGTDIICECDQYPENGERFLLHECFCKDLEIQTWDEDQWTEYCSTEDGFQIVDGDAWMELPHPPMEGLE